MLQETISLNGISLPVMAVDTAVIGSGCAGFNAADWLFDLGRRDIALITEGVHMGTSRNTGSDKQTYYKLTLSGEAGDSVMEMAKDLFSGGGVNGDTALAEASCSVRSFIKLSNLGVPFPTDEFGGFVGYRTDHDPRQRATSAGPLTSRYMTEALEASVRRKGIPIFDNTMVFRLLVSDAGLEGALCLSTSPAALSSPSRGMAVLRAKRIILATGGPAGCYLHSVYPESQTGMSGMALEAGAQGCNLNQWQYGLASVQFRWNVSGTYQQVLPRYISIDPAGKEREFLPEYFSSPQEALHMEFRKGYEWPFDTEKLRGSSRIDCIVYHETARGNRVFMDFRQNPMGLEDGISALDPEAASYLTNSGALQDTPIQRLLHMNPQAVELYRSHGIDLETEPLEIRVCAQHHNGGLSVDSNWQTTLPGLYAAGEAAGTFGSRRPGGSALNSTQVGSLRAAEHIACTTSPQTDLPKNFLSQAAREAESFLRDMELALSEKPSGESPLVIRHKVAEHMSLFAGMVRSPEEMKKLDAELKGLLSSLFSSACLKGPEELPFLLKNRDLFLTMEAVLSAMQKAAEVLQTQGSGLVAAKEGESAENVHPLLPEFRYAPSIPQRENRLLITGLQEGDFCSQFESVRPIPAPESWFETAWAHYRERTKPLAKPWEETGS